MTRLLLVAAALVVVLAAAGVGAGAEWDVYPGAGTPIQTAIDGAGEGDTIYVHAGTYVENVNVYKQLTLEGDGADVVTVRAESRNDHVFEVTADYVNISGFNATGATGHENAGIYLNGRQHCNISDNIADSNLVGIDLSSSSNNTLTNNTADSNDCGIYIVSIHLRSSSNYNTLTNNTASNNWHGGIALSSSSANVLTNNTFTKNGLYVDSSYGSTVENNTVNDKPLAYYEDISDIKILDAGQVILVNCSNITVADLNLSYASVGVELWETDDCVILNNSVSNNHYGIRVSSSSNNNLVYHNNLINNERNAYDTGTNQWDSGSEGNYYSDYNGTDPDGDGIGNDRFPLMQPWSTTSQKGDLNRDNQITTADAVITLQIAAGGSASCDPATLAAADVSGDGRVTSLDALMIMQAAAGRIAL